MHAKPTRKEAEKAVRTLLRWAGDDPDREGLAETPHRVVQAYEDWFSGYGQDPEEYLKRTFEEIEGYDDMVILKDIRFEIHCEHHLAPIIGRVHVGYLPTKRVVGISKLARVVEAYARRLQVQEKMNAQIANTIQNVLRAQGCGGRDRGRTSMHDHARRAQDRRHHGHLDHAGRLPAQFRHAPRISQHHRQSCQPRRPMMPALDLVKDLIAFDTTSRGSNLGADRLCASLA